MGRHSFFGLVAAGLAGLLELILMLILELIATMLVYTYLNLYHLETFGSLVRLARSVLDLLTVQVDYWLPRSADSAYATLFGELGPKSILLLLIGLVVAAIIRSLARLIGRTARGTRRQHVAHPSN